MVNALFIFDETDKTKPKTIFTNNSAIRDELNSRGIGFDSYPRKDPKGSVPNLPNNKLIEAIQKNFNLQHYDLGSIGPKSSDHYREVFNRNFQLHQHEHPEIRLFLNGGGAFGLSIGQWIAICILGPGGFINIPENTLHWFDYGEVSDSQKPIYEVIRFWKDIDLKASGMIPIPSHDKGNAKEWINDFPRYNELLKSLK